MKGSKRKRIASSKGSKNVLQQTRKRKEKVVGNAVIDIQESVVISDITSSCTCKPPVYSACSPTVVVLLTSTKQ
jgi:hypothetical protein